MINPLLSGLARRVESDANDVVLTDCKTGRHVSAGDFWTASHRIAEKIEKQGVGKGDHVVVTMAPGELFCQIIYATFVIGAVPAFMDPGMNPVALQKCIEELAPALWISDRHVAGFQYLDPAALAVDSLADSPLLPRLLLDLHEDESCMMLYTSGTTGLPKGVPWTCSQLRSHLDYQENYYKKFSIASEYALFSHLAITAIAMGRRSVVPSLNSLQPALIDMNVAYRQMAHYGCDYVFASPTFWQRMVQFCQDEGVTLSQVKVATTAGASLNGAMLRNLKHVLPQAHIFVPYASTEVIMPISNIGLDEMSRLSANGVAQGKGIPLGIAAEDMDIRIIRHDAQTRSPFTASEFLGPGEIGEIVVSGPRVTLEYFKRPALNAEVKLREGESNKLWHKMGDVGYIDESGMAWFLCRKKYVYSTKSGNVYPDQMEQFYNHHLGIYESSVIFDSRKEQVVLIIPQAFFKPGQDESVRNLALSGGFPIPVVKYYPGRLPSDPRHNSKIDRDRLLEWVLLEEDNHMPHGLDSALT